MSKIIKGIEAGLRLRLGLGLGLKLGGIYACNFQAYEGSQIVASQDLFIQYALKGDLRFIQL